MRKGCPLNTLKELSGRKKRVNLFLKTTLVPGIAAPSHSIQLGLVTIKDIDPNYV